MRFVHALAISVLVIFGVYILYFNLVMALNVVGSSNHLTPFLGLFVLDNTRWTSDYYFGFNSIRYALDDLPSVVRFDYTLEMFEQFVDSLTGFSDTLDKISNFNYFSGDGSLWDTLVAIGNLVWDIGSIFFSILTAPFRMLIAFITLNIEIFTTIIDVLVYIWGILNGTYNLPIDNWSSPLSGQATTNVTTTGIPPVIHITNNGGTISYY